VVSGLLQVLSPSHMDVENSELPEKSQEQLIPSHVRSMWGKCGRCCVHSGQGQAGYRSQSLTGPSSDGEGWYLVEKRGLQGAYPSPASQRLPPGTSVGLEHDDRMLPEARCRGSRL
jgi:hypothetical protein